MKQFVSLLCFLAASAAPAAAQSFTLAAAPGGAQIFGFDKVGNRVLLGTGTAKVKLEKDATNRFLIQAPGFATLDTVFARGGKYGKIVNVTLQTRVVKVTALPYDAEIYVDGQKSNGDVFVPPGTPVTVEVRKPGFKTEKRVYKNEAGAELPLNERFELVDKVINIQPSIPRNTDANASPATVSADGNVVGTGNVDVVIPTDRCVSITVSSRGYKPEVTNVCNKPDMPIARVLSVPLQDRLVTIAPVPQTATVYVDDQAMGRGTQNVVVKRDACIKVWVAAASYATDYREFCNRENTPLVDEVRVALVSDEAYSSSIQSDQANVNFTIEVGGAKTMDQAWRVISQVVLGEFDVIEITDKETGYMRTAWEVSNFSTNTIRTRVIVKLGDTQPLKYVVKVASEQSGRPRTSVKNDEEFKEWDRLLNSYKDIINELQARLR